MAQMSQLKKIGFVKKNTKHKRIFCIDGETGRDVIEKEQSDKSIDIKSITIMIYVWKYNYLCI